MHELAIIKDIILTARKYASKYGSDKIKEVNIVVGDLSGLVDDSMKYYFSQISKSSNLGKTRLKIKRVRAVAYCKSCKSNFSVKIPLKAECPKCSGNNINIRQGTQFYIDSIIV